MYDPTKSVGNQNEKMDAEVIPFIDGNENRLHKKRNSRVRMAKRKR